MEQFLQHLLNGMILGGTYALLGIGLTLIFGIMRLVNIGHGDLIVLAAFLALTVTQSLGWHPLATFLIVLTLTVATIVASSEAQRAREQREAARRVRSFLADELTTLVDPQRTSRDRVREVLDER